MRYEQDKKYGEKRDKVAKMNNNAKLGEGGGNAG